MGFAVAIAALTAACGDTPHTLVVVVNGYTPSATPPLVVYRAFWQAVSFSSPIPPGASSDPQATVVASENPAYVVLAPGWDPSSSTTPASLTVMQSRGGYSVHLDNTLHILVDDANFAGNCAAGSVLSQPQADFLTQRVFPAVFANLRYDAATCATAPLGEAGTP